MLVQHMGLVSEIGTETLSFAEVSRAGAALQKQLARDFGPIWGVDATIDAFARLEDVPLGYWPIVVEEDIQVAGAAGIHLDRNGQPFALVQYSNRWTLTASHEMLEMAADPFGNRVISARSIKPDLGRVEYLVEVCDPCEAPDFAYHANGVSVSDFYTPNFFDPVIDPGVRYSFTGAITKPLDVLKGGYISFHDPVSDHWWQQTFFDDTPTFSDLGVLSQAGGTGIRSLIDALTNVPGYLEDVPSDTRFAKLAQSAGEAIETASSAKADALRAQIKELKGTR